MGRTLGLASLMIAAMLVSGCAMCCSPYDEAYGYTGGRWQRTDLCQGRVGSAFAPAGSEGEAILESDADELPAPAPSPPTDQGPLKSIKKSSDWSGDLMNE
jgi:hypothetical protein